MLPILGTIQTKLIIFGVVAALFAGIGGYAYITKLKLDKAETDLLQAQKEIFILTDTITAMQIEAKKTEETIKEIRILTTSIRKELDDERKKTRELDDKFSRHDLGFLISKKPVLVTNRINAATKRVWAEFETISKEGIH